MQLTNRADEKETCGAETKGECFWIGATGDCCERHSATFVTLRGFQRLRAYFEDIQVCFKHK